MRTSAVPDRIAFPIRIGVRNPCAASCDQIKTYAIFVAETSLP